MGRKHFYLFRYASKAWRIGEGRSVQEGYRDAFGCNYLSPHSTTKYKDMGTRSPKYLSVKAKEAFYSDSDWLDLP